MALARLTPEHYSALARTENNRIAPLLTIRSCARYRARWPGEDGPRRQTMEWPTWFGYAAVWTTIVKMEWPTWFGYAAVTTSIVTCAMRTMVPLRILSLV